MYNKNNIKGLIIIMNKDSGLTYEIGKLHPDIAGYVITKCQTNGKERYSTLSKVINGINSGKYPIVGYSSLYQKPNIINNTYAIY